MTKVMTIEGMTCGHCSRRVEQALTALDGVGAVVDLERNEARLSSARAISNDELIRAVDAAGYTVSSVQELT